MFRCQLSGQNSKPGQKAVRVVLETRRKAYIVTKKAPMGTKDDKGEPVKEIIETVYGHEIVKEVLALPEVAQEYLNEKIQS